MTKSSDLAGLAGRVEQATGPDRALNREVALVAGWHRYSPAEMGRSNPGWIAPEDFAGETVGKDGRRRPVLDSLHGTTIWREPRDYLGSLDAAMTLVPDGWYWMAGNRDRITPRAYVENGKPAFEGISSRRNPDRHWFEVKAATPALALCAAALRARTHLQENSNG